MGRLVLGRSVHVASIGARLGLEDHGLERDIRVSKQRPATNSWSQAENSADISPNRVAGDVRAKARTSTARVS